MSSWGKLETIMAGFSVVVVLAGVLFTQSVMTYNAQTRLTTIELELRNRDAIIERTHEDHAKLSELDAKVAINDARAVVQTGVLIRHSQRLNEAETSTAVASAVFKELTIAVREFSATTKTLTESVIRMDGRLRIIEKKPLE